MYYSVQTYKCKKEKFLEDFTFDKRIKSGRTSIYKNCRCLHIKDRDIIGNRYNLKSIEYTNGTKLCTFCNNIKDKINFSCKKTGKLLSCCKNCRSTYQKLKAYNISKEEYIDLITNNNGLCKICGNPENGRNLCIDHCHTTGKIRGLLCSSCNLGLGIFKENIESLKNAIKYLEINKQN